MADLRVQPVGPWQYETCGRELLFVVDPGSPPGMREVWRDHCGTEHFAPGHVLGFFFRTKDGNWVDVPEPQASEDEHVRGEVEESLQGRHVGRRPKVG